MQLITDYTYTTQRGDVESHKAYSPPLHTTNTSRQNHTDFTGFYNSFTESNMNNYKSLNRVRKYLESQYTINLIDQFFESQQSSKAILLKLGKTHFHKQLVISQINLKSEYQTFLFYQSTNLSIFSSLKEDSFYKPWEDTIEDKFEQPKS